MQHVRDYLTILESAIAHFPWFLLDWPFWVT